MENIQWLLILTTLDYWKEWFILGLFDVLEKVVGGLANTAKMMETTLKRQAETRGFEAQNQFCTEEFKCCYCGRPWYFSKSMKEDEKYVKAQPKHKCTNGDGKYHLMRRV